MDDMKETSSVKIKVKEVVNNDGDDPLETGHWVTELFPVTYTLSKKEIEMTEDPKPATLSIFEQLARRVSPLDEAGLKNIYEKVWLLMYMENEEKKKREKIKKENTKKAQEEEERSRRLKARQEAKARELKGPQTLQEAAQQYLLSSGVVAISTDDECIWNSDEISILRNVFRKTKEENHKLNAELHTIKHDFNKLRKKCEKLSSALDTKSTNLNNALKANERFKIIVDNLKKEVKKLEATVKFLHDQLDEERVRQSGLAKQGHHLQLELDRERLNRQKTEQNLLLQQEHSDRQLELQQEQLQMQHERETVKLQNFIQNLQDELGKEKEIHQRSIRALDHLRTHFASLQLNEGNAQNQLPEWTY